MSKKFLLLVISCLFCFGANAQSFRENFIRALNAKNMTKVVDAAKFPQRSYDETDLDFLIND